MQLDSSFSVVAPIHEVWQALMDFERVAGCVPGAQILGKLSDDAYQVGLQVKMGPVTMQYKGQMTVLERDADAHRAVFEGKAQETRGQGTAQGSATLTLVEVDGATQGTVSADISLSGKVAAMGKGVIGSVTDHMMTLFATNLQSMVGASAAPEPQAESATAAPAEAGSSAPPRPDSQPRTPAQPVMVPSAGPSLDAMSLAKGVVMDQLSSPAKLIGMVVAVAFVAYRVGTFVSTRRWIRLSTARGFSPDA
ncbi:carbon monoxide dehydrogenase subunit G [Marisediminicola sp. UYEF4]|uniref:SRPBCC family protein n=1 Tax=Marisediminicola sp. UYEF4 TaxID=1756384 RepID=UPI00339B2A22